MKAEERAIQILFADPALWRDLHDEKRQLLMALPSPHGEVFTFLDKQCPTTALKLRRALWGFKWGKEVKTLTDAVAGPLSLDELLDVIKAKGKWNE